MFSNHRIFELAKDVEKPTSNQDAARVDEQRGIAAIADGVSSTLFAGRWARSLVDAVMASPPDPYDAESMDPWLAEKRKEWNASVDPSSLAWHQKAKLKDGASSTLLWVRMEQSSDDPEAFAYRCYAIGDCCLFHVREDETLRAFPLEKSSDFDTDPEVVRSAAIPGKKASKSLVFQT
ncbi:MAG: protein phosphatase 2C domain-containing protein, partial [Planctomycetales bacterium]